MQALCEFVIVYFILLIAYYLLLGLKYRKYDKNKLPIEVIYLKSLYNVDIDKNNYHKYHLLCIFVNSLIMTIIYVIISRLIKGFIWQLLVGFVLLMLLIIIAYGILGRIFGEDKKNK